MGIRFFSLSLVGVALASPVFAQESPQADRYHGALGLSMMEAGDYKVNAWNVKAGRRFGETFGVELDVMGAGTKDIQGVNNIATKLRIKHGATLFGSVSHTFGERLEVTARAGYGLVAYDGRDATDTPFDDESTGAAYVVSAQYFLTRRTGLRLDYSQIALDDPDTLSGWTVSLVRNF